MSFLDSFKRRAMPLGGPLDGDTRPVPIREPVTHDYTRRCWGHDYTFTPINGGKRAELTGWGYGIAKGDYLILPNKGCTTCYRVDEISYYSDPPDMWRAKATFAPRQATPAVS